MRNIERFPSKQMYPYLSLVERKVAEFYHNIDRRRWLVWVKITYFHRFFRTIHGVLTQQFTPHSRCILWQKVAHPLFVFLVQSSWSSSLALVQLHVEGQLLTESWERDDRNSFGWGQSCHHKTNSCYNMIIIMLLLLKIQNLIPVFLNSSTHGFFSLFVYYRCNQIIMFWWTQQKNYQIHLSRLCALSSHKYFLHMTWPLRKKNTYSFRDEREWLLRCREREQEWRTPFPRVRNMKGMKKHRGYHSREWEQEGREQKRMIWLYQKNIKKYLAWY